MTETIADFHNRGMTSREISNALLASGRLKITSDPQTYVCNMLRQMGLKPNKRKPNYI